MSSNSHSSLASASPLQKLREAVTFLRWRLHGQINAAAFDQVFEDIDRYRTTFECHSGRSFADAHVLEIGFGARPWRLIALMSVGIDVRGIDLDMPMLEFSPRQLMRILKTNGSERALKSLVRSALFDSRDRAALGEALRKRGFSLRIDISRFLVGDAAQYDYGDQPIDFIYSEDVFEHIPPAALENLIARLSRRLSPQGVALITPNIFTGVTGGHLPEWYKHTLNQNLPRKSEPWEHLRKNRFRANTYLNCLPRSAYRELFNRYFTIVDEREVDPDLGQRWLTHEVRADLTQWSEEELFSNTVRFVLKPKAT